MKEKTADRMFEELGFKKEMVEDTITGEEIKFVHQYRRFDGNYDETISFNDTTKLMFYENLLFNKPSLNLFEPNLLKAIYKKCEELRMDIEEAIKKLNKFNEYENAVVLTEDALYEIQDAIETILKELEMKDKMIDILAVQLIGLAVWNDKKDDAIIFKNKEEVKQYFERKVEDV